MTGRVSGPSAAYAERFFYAMVSAVASSFYCLCSWFDVHSDSLLTVITWCSGLCLKMTQIKKL